MQRVADNKKYSADTAPQGLSSRARNTPFLSGVIFQAKRHITAKRLLRSIPILTILLVISTFSIMLYQLYQERPFIVESAQSKLQMTTVYVASQIEVRSSSQNQTQDTMLGSFFRHFSVDADQMVFLVNETGIIIQSFPASFKYENKQLSEILNGSHTLLHQHYTADVIEISDRAGNNYISTGKAISSSKLTVVSIHAIDDILGTWTARVKFQITLLAFFSIILLVITYAYFLRASQSDEDRVNHRLESEHSYIAFKNGRSARWEWDISRAQIRWFKSMSSLFGLQPSSKQLHLNEFAKLIHADDVNFLKLADDLSSGSQESIDVTFRIEQPDGTWRWLALEAQCHYEERSSSLMALGTLRDISNEKRKDAANAVAESRLRDAIEVVSEAFALWDDRGRLVKCNKAFLKMHGLSRQEARPGTDIDELTQNAKTPEALWTLTDARLKRDLEFVTRFDDGRHVEMEKRTVNTGGFVTVGKDISAHKNSEAALVEHQDKLNSTIEDLKSARAEAEGANQQLIAIAEQHVAAEKRANEANHAKTDFLANMSHELRTPLNAIIGFSEMMQTQVLGPLGAAKYQEYANDINSSGMQLLSVINDILDMSKIEAGKVKLQFEPVDITMVIDDTIKILSAQASKKAISFIRSIDTVSTIQADQRAFKQILTNLLSNAVKFSHPSGRVFISLTTSASGGPLLTIQDEGVGIAPAEVEKLGKPFVQLSDPLTTTLEGSGLGLAISRSLAELHGGRMDIRSELNAGTSVIIELPNEASRRVPSTPRNTFMD